MDKEYWKRELFSVYNRNENEGEFSTHKSTLKPSKDAFLYVTRDPLNENVVQTRDNTYGNSPFLPYILAAGAACLLIIVIVNIFFFMARRKRQKEIDEEQSSSILIYPSQQSGCAPQFLTKEIHFSLPPLRSTSLGDLFEDNPYDSDVGTDSLLLSTVGHYRSNSFSCYGLGVIEPALYKSTLDLDEIQWPEGHIGRLWFSLRYEPSTEKLLVSLLKAKNLPSRTVGTVNSCDPFVKLQLMPDERRYLQSKQKKKTCNPYFDETLVFQVSAKDMSDHTLKLTVIDGGRQKKKSEIGYVTFPLKELEIGDGNDQQLFKMDLEKEPQEIKTDFGELLISLVYNENLSRLCTTVIEARGLKDLGKHRQESILTEIELAANEVRHVLIELNDWAKPQKKSKRLVNLLDGVYIYSDPYGVVLIIGAWNYPIQLTITPLIGAIAAGNTVILKPSELAPFTENLLATTLPKYLDSECFQVYTGGIEETTEILKQKFDYIFFTGSTNVGRIIYQTASQNLTPVTLELGGKSPVYLDDTVDMELATRRILWGKLINSGQTCIAPDYLLCTESVQELFLREAEKVLTEFYGSDAKGSPYLSRIVNEKMFKRLTEFLRPDQIAIGGKFNMNERRISPTILINVKPHEPVMQEEIFGPILVIVNIKSVDEAIDFINSRNKPLALYVFSKNKSTQNRFLIETSAGGVCINDTATHLIVETLPFGGVGASGMGSYHGRKSFTTFSHQKSVLIKDSSYFSELGMSLRYPPYSDSKINIMNFILKQRKGIPLSKSFFVFIFGILFAYFVQFLWRLLCDK